MSNARVLREVKVRGRGRFNVAKVVDGAAVIAGARLLVTSNGRDLHRRSRLPTHAYCFHAEGERWYAGGGGGRFAVSTNRGESWALIALPDLGGADLLAFCRDDRGDCWLGADGGALLKSAHPERGWAVVDVGERFAAVTDIRAYDGKVWFVGDGLAVREGDRTTRVPGLGTTVFSRLAQAPSGALILLGNDGQIWRSEDAQGWVQVASGTVENLEDFAWVEGSLLVVGGLAGRKGVLLESTDEGRTFTRRAELMQKAYAIGSWGTGAFIAGERLLLCTFSADDDVHWKDAPDVFALASPTVPADFVAAVALTSAQRDEMFHLLEGEAQAGWNALAATHLRQGPRDENPALAQNVDDHVNDEAIWQVLGDGLQAAGDPRGELAVLQQRLAATPGNSELARAVAAQLTQHPSLFGSLEKVAEALNLGWKHGFITAARIANNGHFNEREDVLTIPQVLAELLDHPSARFLKALTVGVVTFEENTYSDVIAELERRTLPTLRELYLGDFGSDELELSWSELVGVERLPGSLPRLESLRLRAGSMSLGRLSHPRLKHLIIETRGLTQENLRDLLSASLPHLETLRLQFGQHSCGSDVGAEHVLPLIHATRFPRLRELGLTNANFITELVEALAQSRLVAQLEVLDLSMGTLADEGARALASAAPAFTHLKRLDLSQSYLTDDAQRVVKHLCADVDLADMRDDEGDPDKRYTVIGE